MSRTLRYILIGVGIFFAILQFVGPTRPAVSLENPEDLMQSTEISQDISVMLETACYDCHSMETQYPWYSHIAPVSWFLYGHIDHGREELNFSDWASMDKRSKLKALKDIQEEVEQKEMPMNSYIRMHKEAELTDAQREALVAWAKEYSRQVFKE